MTRNRVLIGILIAAAVIRLVLFAFVLWQDQPGTFALADTQGYIHIADNVLAGHGFSMATTSPYLPDSIRTPVFPFILASVKGIFGTPVPYILLQIVLAVALVYVTYCIALLVTEKENVALAAAALMAFEPYSVFINLSLLTETLFAFLVTAGAYYTCLYIRDNKLFPLCAASGLFALAALTRPIAQFFPLILLLLVVYRESPRAYAKYFVAAIMPFLIVASPWLIRNYVVFGTPSLSSGGFQNVYSDLGATIISYRDGVEWRTAKNTLEADFAERHYIPLSTIQQNLALSPILFSEGLLLMFRNPVATAMSFVSVAIAYFTNDAWSYYFDHWNWIAPFEYGFSPTHSLLTDGPLVTAQRAIEAAGPGIAIPIIGRLFWLATILCFFAGVWSLRRAGSERRIIALFILASILYYLVLSWSTGAGVNGRYRYPLNPLIFTGASLGAAYLYIRFKGMIKRVGKKSI